MPVTQGAKSFRVRHTACRSRSHIHGPHALCTPREGDACRFAVWAVAQQPVSVLTAMAFAMPTAASVTVLFFLAEGSAPTSMSMMSKHVFVLCLIVRCLCNGDKLSVALTAVNMQRYLYFLYCTKKPRKLGVPGLFGDKKMIVRVRLRTSQHIPFRERFIQVHPCVSG